MRTLTLLIFLIISSSSYSQNVKLKFYNLTGYNIDSVNTSINYITLAKDSVTPFINLKSIIYHDGSPFAYYGKETIRELGQRIQLTPDCIPKSQTVTEGVFEFDYKLRIEKKGYYQLYLEPHTEHHLRNH